MVSLPIPDKQSPIRYADIRFDGRSIAPLVSDLTQGRIPPHYRAHLDPDLHPESLPRLAGWRPVLGQTGAAQGHLRNNAIGSGDLFLFFGLFRRADLADGRHGWVKDARPCHVIWGWLQVGEVLPLATSAAEDYGWAAYHPHFHRGHETNNVLYISSPHLTLDGVGPLEINGAGVFPFFSISRQLTAPSASSPSSWELPGWFFPEHERTPLTFHADPSLWDKAGSKTRLRASARGQEFVLDCNEYPEAVPWLADLAQETGSSC